MSRAQVRYPLHHLQNPRSPKNTNCHSWSKHRKHRLLNKLTQLQLVALAKSPHCDVNLLLHFPHSRYHPTRQPIHQHEEPQRPIAMNIYSQLGGTKTTSLIALLLMKYLHHYFRLPMLSHLSCSTAMLQMHCLLRKFEKSPTKKTETLQLCDFPMSELNYCQSSTPQMQIHEDFWPWLLTETNTTEI